MSYQPGELVVKPAISPPPDPAGSAAIIFLHGFGDEAAPWATVADQFQNANKLPYLEWVIPNAPESNENMSTAWYTPSRLTPFPASRPELEDDEDEEGMMQSLKYVVSLIDELVAKGIPAKRIVLAGFSQGHAMSLLVGLTSKYADKLGGIVGLSGYLPLIKRIEQLRKEGGLPAEVGDTPMFLVRGKNDMLVPKRYIKMQQEKLTELGVPESSLEIHEYDGLGHAVVQRELIDLVIWLEKTLTPPSE